MEHLAGSIVTDHLNRPLHVNRFRQMAGVEIMTFQEIILTLHKYWAKQGCLLVAAVRH